MRPCEIGSEFWDIPRAEQENNQFSGATQWFQSGRSALGYIISVMKKKQRFGSVAMPSWCCESMIRPFAERGIEVKFYPVCLDESHRLVRNTEAVTHCDALFAMDYFGYAAGADSISYGGTVIRDVTHSVFSRVSSDADYTFGSLRKWAGFWTGGFVLSNAAWQAADVPAAEPMYCRLREQAMRGKALYISGKSDSKDYLQTFSEAEQRLDRGDICLAADRDVDAARHLDIGLIKERRRKNAKRLLEALSDMALFPEMGEDDCPLFVPIIVPNGKRDELRRYLIENSIYCPAHWPLSEYHKLDEKVQTLYKDELSLVCDQRYTEEDMVRIIETIKQFWKRA